MWPRSFSMHSVTKGNFFCFTFSFILPLLCLGNGTLQSSLLVWPSVVAIKREGGILPSWLTRETTSWSMWEIASFFYSCKCGRTTSIIMMAHISHFRPFRRRCNLMFVLLIYFTISRFDDLFKRKEEKKVSSFPSSQIFIGCWSLPFSSTSSNALWLHCTEK